MINSLDLQSTNQHLRKVHRIGKLLILFIVTSLLSVTGLYSWPRVQKDADANQVLRFRFQSGETSVQVFGLVYAPAFGFPGGAGMVVSIMHEGRHTTGGYHYTWNDVKITDSGLTMGPQSIELGHSIRVSFHSGDLTLNLTAPGAERKSGPRFMISQRGRSLLSIDGADSIPDSLVSMSIYGKKVTLRGTVMVDHWKLPRDLPEDMQSIRITTSRGEKSIFLAQPEFASRMETYIQTGESDGQAHFREIPGKSSDWHYNSECKLELELGNPVHVLNGDSIPSTTRLLGLYLGKNPEIVSYDSTIIDICGPSVKRRPAETTVLTLR